LAEGGALEELAAFGGEEERGRQEDWEKLHGG
jgi:hypothetical protein